MQKYLAYSGRYLTLGLQKQPVGLPDNTVPGRFCGVTHGASPGDNMLEASGLNKPLLPQRHGRRYFLPLIGNLPGEFWRRQVRKSADGC
jgi:hypothetical protein